MELTHLTSDGQVSMVDVSAKPVERRVAIAEGIIRLQPATLEKINQSQIAKGNVIAVAQVAAILATKRTDELIPLCHTLPIQNTEVTFEQLAEGIRIRCAVVTNAQTGVEMEALSGVTIGALTIYDMCKAVDKTMEITDVHLVLKTKEAL
ncbi:MAG TPA: cyclic pyranopterin monophosphate synthase MoaC [Chthoniobacterales bacterium]|jgi:cyclic pyranopterin monophosphate synthase|nr:cyclic pyranopterin monophosphate synthase MoaC [Chthoniobacterales bacterium]